MIVRKIWTVNNRQRLSQQIKEIFNSYREEKDTKLTIKLSLFGEPSGHQMNSSCERSEQKQIVHRFAQWITLCTTQDLQERIKALKIYTTLQLAVLLLFDLTQSSEDVLIQQRQRLILTLKMYIPYYYKNIIRQS